MGIIGIIRALVAVLFLAAVVFVADIRVEDVEPEVATDESVLEDVEKVAEPRFYVSSDVLEQGDTLVVKVSGEGAESAEGTFGGTPLHFFKNSVGESVAINGIDVKTKEGTRTLSLQMSGTSTSRAIKIVKKDFPITKIVVTKELAEKGYTPATITKSLEEKEKPSIGEIVSVFTPLSYFEKPFTAPLSSVEIVGAFGNIREENGSAFRHLGIDLEADEGTPVFAANDGVVSFSDELPTYGNTLVIDHGLGIYSLYLHLSEFETEKSESVKRGDLIGKSGSTGYSITPHLHFSIKANGASVDPLVFIQTVEKAFEE